MTKNTIIPAAVTILSAALFSFTIISQEWTVNSADAKIRFNTPVAGHTGEVAGLTATFKFDPLDLKASEISAAVDATTLKSDNEKLTAHLHSADFFDVANHPKITFKSDSVIKNDTAFVAYGKLALRDSVKSVMIPFKFVQDGNKAMVSGTLDLFAGDYGVGKKSPTGKDHTILTIEVPVSK